MKFSTLFVSLLIGSAAALPLNPRSESASESTSISTSAEAEETATETVEAATETFSTESVEETLTESLSETLTETLATSTSVAFEATATADFGISPSGGSSFPPSFAPPSSIGAFIGAAFVLTNNPVANQIVATLVGIDGSLTVGGVFNTGGRGSHAGDLSVVDPLFSQGALQVLGNFVFAVNAGSNTISTFLIDPFNPINLVPFGFPVSSGGEFPISLAVSTVNNLVCVLNGGFFASINCFVVDPILGLVPISGGFVQLNLGLVTPPSSIFGTASNIIFNEASTQLIISVKGNNNNFGGQLAVFDITKFGVISSSFNSLVPAAGATSPFGLVGIPGQNAFFTADPSVGAVIFDASSGLSSIINIPNQISTCWSAFSKISNSFFVSDSGAGVITEIALDRNLRGSIIGQTPFGVGASVLDLQIGSFGGLEFLFALNPINLAINVLQIFSVGNIAVVQEFSLVSAFQGLSITSSDVVGIALWSKGF